MGNMDAKPKPKPKPKPEQQESMLAENCTHVLANGIAMAENINDPLTVAHGAINIFASIIGIFQELFKNAKINGLSEDEISRELYTKLLEHNIHEALAEHITRLAMQPSE